MHIQIATLGKIMENKIIFFDVDGTLVDFTKKIPESTLLALDKAKKRGHKIFVCTGRGRDLLPEEILAVQFDGYVAAAGAYVECDGKVVFHHHMSMDDLQRVVDFCEENKVTCSFQTRNKTFVEKKYFENYHNYMFEHFGLKHREVEMIDLSGDLLARMQAELSDVEKLLYVDCPCNVKETKEALGENFDVTAMSFEKINDACGEITTAGVHKASGMQRVLEYYGKDRADSVAFGDGPNDFEMIQFANIGVAMGNAIPELKEVADMVTTSVMDEGIRKGLEKLNLI